MGQHHSGLLLCTAISLTHVRGDSVFCTHMRERVRTNKFA
jgi:hypothetical protein